MIDGWRDERDSYDTLYVPFVWVPDGAPHPTEWLAEHPDAFWVPARLVRDQVSVDDPDEASDGFGQSDGAAPAGGLGEPVSFEASQWSWSAEDQAVPASAAPASSRYDDPVAAYLRVNDMFARLGVGTMPGSTGSPMQTEALANGSGPASLRHPGLVQDDVVQPIAESKGKQADPTAPVAVTDSQGNVITSNGKPVQRPAGFSPNFFYPARP